MCIIVGFAGISAVLAVVTLAFYLTSERFAASEERKQADRKR